MLKKLRILSSNIPNEYNEGFIIDYKKNKIVNISKNYSIRIPFKIIKSEIFSFELLIENSSVNLNFIIDTQFIKNNIYELEYIKNKNYIFSILKCAFKNLPKNNSINRFYDIKDIISKKANYILRDNIIKLDNLYFNLEMESIFTENNNSLVYLKPKIYLLFGTIYNYNKPKDYKLCIIDDKYKLDKSNLIISFDNFESISCEDINISSTIGVCKEFFMSNEYTKKYKDYHNNYRCCHAFQNFKTHFSKSNPKLNYNLEILDNIIFIINNISKKQLTKHPLINSDNHIIIISKKINNDEIKNSYKLLNHKYKSSNVNTDIIMNNQLYFDRNKYLLSKLYSNDNTIINTKYFFNECEFISSNFSVFEHYISQECPITREKIGKSSYIKFGCGHCFSYDGFDQYLLKTRKCPYCNADIKSYDINFYKRNVMNLILENYEIDNNDIYLFYKNSNKFIDFMSNYCISYKIEDELINLELEPNSILVLDINLSEYDFTNLSITNLNVMNTIKLIKLDFYY
tara:strand:- start:487 stop:2031 length:1545 start_codon:yes stop_codon:yes gene_type:complete